MARRKRSPGGSEPYRKLQAVMATRSASRIRQDAVVKAATILLQKQWRENFAKKTTKKLLDQFSGLGLNKAAVGEISFESLVLKLRETPVVDSMKQIFQRIHFQCNMRHHVVRTDVDPPKINIRVILAAYMIVVRPSHVFETVGQLEQSLRDSAGELINKFEGIVDHLKSQETNSCFSNIPPEATVDFSTLIREYLLRFKAWKVPDEAKLTIRITHALMALYQARGHLSSEEPADSRLSVEFCDQITRLRGKLQQIAGAEALAKFDEQRISGNFPTINGGDGSSGGSSSSGGAYAALPGRMTNELLAYELILNPEFQLNDNGGDGMINPVYQRIRESFHAAFWSSLADDIRLSTPCYARVFRVLTEVRDGICDLTGTGSSHQINEILDVDLIRQQIAEKAFTWGAIQNLFATVIGVITTIQSPNRTDETKAKWEEIRDTMAASAPVEQPELICKGLELLLSRVNCMRVDAANARLRLIAPVIRDHGMDYHKGKFLDKLRNGTTTLDRTKIWLEASLTFVVQQNRDVVQEELSTQLSRVVSTCLFRGVVSILESSNDRIITTESIPETFLFDSTRFSLWRGELISISNAACFIAHAHKVHNSKPTEFTQEKLAVTVDFVCDANAELPYSHEDIHADIQQQMDQLTPENPVFLLMKGRISNLVVKKLMLTPSSPIYDAPGDALFNTIRPLMSRINTMVMKMRLVLGVNLQLSWEHYNKIIMDLAPSVLARTALPAV